MNQIINQNTELPDWAEPRALSDLEQGFLARIASLSKQAHQAYSEHVRVLPANDPAWPLRLLSVGSRVVEECCKVIDPGSVYINGELLRLHLSDSIQGGFGECIVDVMASLVDDRSTPPGVYYPEGSCAGLQHTYRHGRQLVLEARGRAALIAALLHSRLEFSGIDSIAFAAVMADIGHAVLMEGAKALTRDVDGAAPVTILEHLEREIYARLGEYIVDQLRGACGEPAGDNQTTNEEAQLQHAES